MNARKEAYAVVASLIESEIRSDERHPASADLTVIVELKRIRDAMSAAAAQPEPTQAVSGDPGKPARRP